MRRDEDEVECSSSSSRMPGRAHARSDTIQKTTEDSSSPPNSTTERSYDRHIRRWYCVTRAAHMTHRSSYHGGVLRGLRGADRPGPHARAHSHYAHFVVN